MAGSGDHIKALLNSHASGDDASFYAVAAQIAAQEARRGHNRLAGELKAMIDAARERPVARETSGVTPIARPRGELSELVSAGYPEVGIDDMVASEELAAQIGEILAEQRQRRVLAERGFDPVHRILLEGPPGTGKTMTAAVLAHELSLPLLTVRLDSVLSKFLGETGSKLRLLFDAVREQRAVYLFDEFDALGAERTGNDVGEARRILNSFLVFLDQAGPDSVVVAATNHSSILDRALFRRFDMVIHYTLPTAPEAREVLRSRLGPMGKGLGLSSSPLAKQLKDLSHAELVKVAESAAKGALIRGSDLVDADELDAALRARRGTTKRG
jgi:SpoVK/Ycf46/Vps4 family AAA+-type ATPase